MMKLSLAFLKEILEYMLRNYRKLHVKKDKLLNNKILIGIKRDGIFVEKNFYSDTECKRLKNKIDELIESGEANVWCDKAGSDHRIYFANEVDEDMNRFYTNPKIRQVLAEYTGTTQPKGMLLAARIEYKPDNIGSGGGWHRDSPFTHQFKAICYLNDVNENNGPFQYIKKSQSKQSVISSYLNKIFHPGQYRFNEEEVSTFLSNQSKEVTSVTGKAGSLVYADTKGIHRGKPLKEGTRYVLFCYFWHGQIPKHFASLKQRRGKG